MTRKKTPKAEKYAVKVITISPEHRDFLSKIGIITDGGRSGIRTGLSRFIGLLIDDYRQKNPQ